MKRLLLTLLLITSTTTFAHGHWVGRPGGGWNWVAPAVVGGVIGYEIARPPVVIQQGPQVIYQQPTVIYNDSNCSPWTQIQNPDGSITTTRTCR